MLSEGARDSALRRELSGCPLLDRALPALDAGMIVQPVVPRHLEALSHTKRLEKVAFLLVGEVTQTQLKELDPGGGGDQLADFEILHPESATRMGVMEVTTTTRSQRARFAAQVRKQPWQLPNLMWSWSIHTNDTADPGQLRRELGPILLAMEETGPPEDWLPERPDFVEPEEGAMPVALVNLGVVAACAWIHHDNPNEALVSVQLSVPGGFFSSQGALTGEVQAELNKADNLAKLSGHLGRAELFVWLDIGNGASAAQTLCTAPWDQTLATATAPILPSGVTAVWAATGMADWPRPATCLLRFDDAGWQSFGRPSLPWTG